jgi:hypothetical protein
MRLKRKFGEVSFDVHQDFEQRMDSERIINDAC